jgi:hypothetical protein
MLINVMTLITPHLILENLEVPFMHTYECLVQCKNIEKKIVQS